MLCFSDETPENCELFISHGGIKLFMYCKSVSYSHVSYLQLDKNENKSIYISARVYDIRL